METFVTYFNSPVGRLQLTGNDHHIRSVLFADAQKRPAPVLPATRVKSGALEQCIAELDEYFAGKRTEFTVPYQLHGSDFQVRVWTELTRIPFGKTITYGEQARRLNNEKAIRAVGTCNGANRISIIVPCHRVIGANGSLTGYGGDLWAKKWLLDHEQKFGSGPVQMQLF